MSDRTQKQKIGEKGEALACRYLQKQGWTVIFRNYRTPFGELDIIARKRDMLAFVEVKTRTSSDYGWPSQAVDSKKQRRLWLSAQFFLKRNPGLSDLAMQMDIIEILIREGLPYLRHLENAFRY